MESTSSILVSRNAGRSGVYVGSVDAKPAEQSHQRILATLIAAGYADGNLVFMREGSLMAQPFDTDKLQLHGEPVVVAEHVGNMASFGYFSVSRAGVLTYRASAARALQATWFDREGKQMGAAAETTPDQQLRLSPDGTGAGGFFSTVILSSVFVMISKFVIQKHSVAREIS
jgi:hypothetical protein